MCFEATRSLLAHMIVADFFFFFFGEKIVADVGKRPK